MQVYGWVRGWVGGWVGGTDPCRNMVVVTEVDQQDIWHSGHLANGSLLLVIGLTEQAGPELRRCLC